MRSLVCFILKISIDKVVISYEGIENLNESKHQFFQHNFVMWPFSKRTKFHDDVSDESDDINEESSFLSEISAENSVSYIASNSDSALSSNYESDCYENNDENNDETLLKNRLLKVLKNVENVGASEFAISGSLSDAPIHAILIKVSQKIFYFDCVGLLNFIFHRKIRR